MGLRVDGQGFDKSSHRNRASRHRINSKLDFEFQMRQIRQIKQTRIGVKLSTTEKNTVKRSRNEPLVKKSEFYEGETKW